MSDRSWRLLDEQITVAPSGRRSFLARALGAGALAVGGALTQACSDPPCDGDRGSDRDVTTLGDPPGGGTDRDTGSRADPVGRGTDSDVGRVGDPPRIADTCDND